MKLFVIAGEPSGDRLGADLIAALKAVHPGIELRGIAGPRMQAQGMDSLFPMEELSVMGLAEILPKYRHLKARIAQTAEAALAWGPDAVITIDSPDFSLRVAKLLKAASDIRTIHYVAPTVWAWRAGRAAKMARVIDHVMALFPFEPPYMTAAGMTCDFVGHPVVMDPQVSKAEREGPEDAPLIALLPGSRRSEVARLLPRLLQAVGQMKGAPQIVLPTLPLLRAQIDQIVQDSPHTPQIIDGAGMDPEEAAAARRSAMAAADLAIAASGTVSLELAAVQTPMVIAYDFNWLTYRIMRAMALVDTVTLVNLVSETRVVPEFLGPQCQPDLIAAAAAQVLTDPGPQLAAMALTMERLGQGGPPPGERAARSVLRAIGP